MERRFLLACLVICSIGVTSFANAQAQAPVAANANSNVVFSCENFVFVQPSKTLTVKAVVKVAAMADGTFVARAILNDRTITSMNIEAMTAEITAEDMNLEALARTNPGVDASKIVSMSTYGDSGTGMISKDIPLSFTVFKDAAGNAVAKVVAPQGGLLAGRCEL